MALFDTSTITDIHACQLIAQDPETTERILSDVDDDMWAAFYGTGLTTPQMPTDNNGFTTSVTLRRYGKYRFLLYVMETLQGSVDTDDTYEDKAEKYEKRSNRAMRQVTRETILDNEENRKQSRVSSAPVW